MPPRWPHNKWRKKLIAQKRRKTYMENYGDNLAGRMVRAIRRLRIAGKLTDAALDKIIEKYIGEFKRRGLMDADGRRLDK